MSERSTGDNLPAAHHGHGASDAVDYSERDERGRYILPLEEHSPRRTDIDARAAKRAERQVAWMFALAAVLLIGGIAAFFGFNSHELIHVPVIGNVSASNFLLGTCIGLGAFFIGAGAIHWARRLMPGDEVVQERHTLRGDEETRADAIAQFKRGAGESGFLQRPLIRRTLLGAMAVFPLPLVVLLGDLGPKP
ncbi:MAG: ubiquinol-cytochrome C reductase, partial [Actinobacteria bacterium]|nr:ubiquinol-cytochrome C reductase [Actinomycetota bacterium]